MKLVEDGWKTDSWHTLEKLYMMLDNSVFSYIIRLYCTFCSSYPETAPIILNEVKVNCTYQLLVIVNYLCLIQN